MHALFFNKTIRMCCPGSFRYHLIKKFSFNPRNKIKKKSSYYQGQPPCVTDYPVIIQRVYETMTIYFTLTIFNSKFFILKQPECFHSSFENSFKREAPFYSMRNLQTSGLCHNSSNYLFLPTQWDQINGKISNATFSR